ncbi:MAG: hypothetical protein IRY85_18185 [Micromonosporaceae bacterium]|nr:hypothetical protein [Micromonosporaceae bacterium]
MSDLTRPGVVPLRPLTTGELLDGAVAVLRTRAGRLVGLGVLFAVLEQVALYPLRSLADLDVTLLPATGRLSEYGWLVVAGFASEAMIISVLAAIAARRGGSLLLGRFAPAVARARWLGVVVALVASGAVVGGSVVWYPFLLDRLEVVGMVLAWGLALVAWAGPYGLIGLAAPAVVIENRPPGSAVVRSLRLASRDWLRVVRIRVLGYVSWALVRLALLASIIALANVVWGGNLPSSTWDRLALAVAAAVVNAVAYPVLGCLDVMLLLEGRMRTEGLDISLRWALRRGVAPSLEVPR